MRGEKSLFGSVTCVVLHAHMLDIAYIAHAISMLILTYTISMN